MRAVHAAADVRTVADVNAGLTTDDAPSAYAAVEGIVTKGPGLRAQGAGKMDKARGQGKGTDVHGVK